MIKKSNFFIRILIKRNNQDKDFRIIVHSWQSIFYGFNLKLCSNLSLQRVALTSNNLSNCAMGVNQNSKLSTPRTVWKLNFCRVESSKLFMVTQCEKITFFSNYVPLSYLLHFLIRRGWHVLDISTYWIMDIIVQYLHM